MNNAPAQQHQRAGEMPFIITSLYDSIAGINQSIPPENDDLVTDIILDLMKSRMIRKVKNVKREDGFRPDTVAFLRGSWERETQRFGFLQNIRSSTD